MNLKEKVVIITGASSGIGKAIVQQVAEQGAHLVLVARREETLQEIAKNLKHRFDTQALVMAMDVTQPENIEQLVSHTLAEFGRIDILVNGAGYGEFKRATEFSYQEIQDMFRLNTFAMMYLSQLIAFEMAQQGSGHIFFVASIAGKIATPASSVYSASKFAIIGYANALRLELQEAGIQVTTVNPGPVDTPFFDRNESVQSYYHRIKSWSMTPDYVAKRIVNAMNRANGTTREINVPFALNVASKMYAIFPKIADYLTLNVFNLKEDKK